MEEHGELRTMEMQSVEKPEGKPVYQIACDDNDCLANAAGVKGSAAKRKLRVTTTGDPRLPPYLG